MSQFDTQCPLTTFPIVHLFCSFFGLVKYTYMDFRQVKIQTQRQLQIRSAPGPWRCDTDGCCCQSQLSPLSVPLLLLQSCKPPIECHRSPGARHQHIFLCCFRHDHPSPLPNLFGWDGKHLLTKGLNKNSNIRDTLHCQNRTNVKMVKCPIDTEPWSHLVFVKNSLTAGCWHQQSIATHSRRRITQDYVKPLLHHTVRVFSH